MTNAIGCDVSRYQITFNPAIATGAINFAIQKISEGLYIHTGLETMWAGVKQIPIRGAYHYQRSGQAWQAQADLFLSLAQAKSFHIYALDLEGYGNIVDAAMLLDTQRIINYWIANTNKRVVLYTNISYYNQLKIIVGTDWLNSIPLWIAYPNHDPGNPVLPVSRATWSIHQYSWTGQAARWGTGANTDEDIFNGTVEQMRTWAGVIDAPPTGETMAKNKVIITWDGGCREREYPHASGVYRNILADNTIHYSDYDPVPDMDDPTNTNKRWIKLQSGWYITTRYPPTSGTIYQRALVEPIVAPPPAPAGDVSIDMTLKSDGTITGTWANV